MPARINLTGDGVTKTFVIPEGVSAPASILGVTVAGVSAPLDPITPLIGANTVQLATAPAANAEVSITYKSAVVDRAF